MGSNQIPTVATFLLLASFGAMADRGAEPCAEAAWRAMPQRPYVAFRRLEADNMKSGRHAWMDVRTAFDGNGVLTIDVLSEGGSEHIRNKVLRAALDRERTLVAQPRGAVPTTGSDSLPCAEPEPDGSGLLRVPLGSARKGHDAVIGHLFLQPSTGDVVKMAGRLAKNPSFWVSNVDVEWSYARVYRDVVLPVSMHSTAKVKIFGLSTFRMTYDYESVDGQPVSSGTRAAR